MSALPTGFMPRSDPLAATSSSFRAPDKLPRLEAAQGGLASTARGEAPWTRRPVQTFDLPCSYKALQDYRAFNTGVWRYHDSVAIAMVACPPPARSRRPMPKIDHQRGWPKLAKPAIDGKHGNKDFGRRRGRHAPGKSGAKSKMGSTTGTFRSTVGSFRKPSKEMPASEEVRLPSLASKPPRGGNALCDFYASQRADMLESDEYETEETALAMDSIVECPTSPPLVASDIHENTSAARAREFQQLGEAHHFGDTATARFRDLGDMISEARKESKPLTGDGKQRQTPRQEKARKESKPLSNDRKQRQTPRQESIAAVSEVKSAIAPNADRITPPSPAEEQEPLNGRQASKHSREKVPQSSRVQLAPSNSPVASQSKPPSQQRTPSFREEHEGIAALADEVKAMEAGIIALDKHAALPTEQQKEAISVPLPTERRRSPSPRERSTEPRRGSGSLNIPAHLQERRSSSNQAAPAESPDLTQMAQTCRGRFSDAGASPKAKRHSMLEASNVIAGSGSARRHSALADPAAAAHTHQEQGHHHPFLRRKRVYHPDASKSPVGETPRASQLAIHRASPRLGSTTPVQHQSISAPSDPRRKGSGDGPDEPDSDKRNLSISTKGERQEASEPANGHASTSEPDSPVSVSEAPPAKPSSLGGEALKGFKAMIAPGVVGESKSEFDICVTLAKQYRLHVEDVRQKHNEFREFDVDGNEELTTDEFQEAIRVHCNIPADEEIPEHLVHTFWASADRNNRGCLDFEEFLVWSITHEYTEDWIVMDTTERLMRNVARTHGFYLPDVERVKKVFDSFDEDKSGAIEEGEFKQCLYSLLKIKNNLDLCDKKFKRFWKEVDTDGSGAIGFEEFVIWYLSFCPEI